MTDEQMYEAAKEWTANHLCLLPGQEVDDVAMVWIEAIKWYKQQTE